MIKNKTKRNETNKNHHKSNRLIEAAIFFIFDFWFFFFDFGHYIDYYDGDDAGNWATIKKILNEKKNSQWKIVFVWMNEKSKVEYGILSSGR